MTGIELIARERQRQIDKEGWTAEHDDEHEDGELALVAALYATPVQLYQLTRDSPSQKQFTDPWPDSWGLEWDKRPRNEKCEIVANEELPRGCYIRQLEKAGALIAAEIDRLQRVASKRQ